MNLTCIKCWTVDSLIKLHLDDCDTFECVECEETFGCEDVRKAVEAAKKWERVLAWVDAAPVEEVAAN